MRLILASWVLLAGFGPVEPAYRIDFTLSIDSAGGEWRFVVEGTTDLPDETLLRGRLVIRERVESLRGGIRIDEDSFEDRPGVDLVVKDGKFRGTLVSVERKPYSLWYRARLKYDPENQEESVALAVKPDDIPKDLHADIENDPATFEKEIAATRRELTKEMDLVFELSRTLRKKLQELIKEPDAKGHRTWAQGFLGRVDEVADRNKTRFSLWPVWLEIQGKMRITGFVARFRQICEAFDEWRAGRQPDQLARIQGQFTAFNAVYAEGREALGIDSPFDREEVAAILGEFEAIVGDLSKLEPAERKAKLPSLRSRGNGALMKLVSERLIPRRAYDRVLALSESFISLCASGKTGAIRERLEEFRIYAGLK